MLCIWETNIAPQLSTFFRIRFNIPLPTFSLHLFKQELLKLGGFSFNSLFYFFDNDIKAFILHIVLSFKICFHSILWQLSLFHSCNCDTCLLNFAILACMRHFHHDILFLFSCLLLFLPNNSAAIFAPTKINKFTSVIDSVWNRLNTSYTPACFFSLFSYLPY